MNILRHGELTRSWAVGLALLAVYAPFSWLIFTEWQYIKLWPVFPGLVISYFMREWVPLSCVPQWTYVLGLALTVLFVTGVIFGLLRVRRGFWPLLAGVFALSCAIASVAHSIMIA